MNKVYYISEDYIKENSELQDDVLIKKLKRNIWIVQQTYVQNILGTALFEKINADIIAGTLTGDYQTIFEDYIQPLTLEYTMYRSAPFIAFALTNKSIVRKDADNSEPATLEEIQFIQTQYQKTGDFLGERLVKTLIQGYTNDGKFPEYGCEMNEDIDKIKADRNNPSSYGGIYLGTNDKTFYNYNNKN